MRPGSWTSLLGTLACTMKQREGRRDMNISLLTLLLSEILPGGEPCKSCILQRQRAVSLETAAIPSPMAKLCWRFSQGQGNPPHSGLLPPLSAAGPSDCHLEIPFLLLRCQGTACLHLAASALPSRALLLAKFLPAVPSERHNSLFTDLFLLPAYELSKECLSLRKTSFPLAIWMLFAWQKPSRDTDSGRHNLKEGLERS